MDVNEKWQNQKKARALYNSNRRVSENARRANDRLMATPEEKQAAKDRRLLATTPETKERANNKRYWRRQFNALSTSLMPNATTFPLYVDSYDKRVRKIIDNAFNWGKYSLPERLILSKGEIKVSLLQIRLDDRPTTMGIILEGGKCITSHLQTSTPASLTCLNIDGYSGIKNEGWFDRSAYARSLGAILCASLFELNKSFRDCTMYVDSYQSQAEITMLYDDWENLQISFIQTIGGINDRYSDTITNLKPIFGPPIILPDNVLAGMLYKLRCISLVPPRVSFPTVSYYVRPPSPPPTAAQIAACSVQKYSMEGI
jgi:hypothetical protein